MEADRRVEGAGDAWPARVEQCDVVGRLDEVARAVGQRERGRPRRLRGRVPGEPELQRSVEGALFEHFEVRARGHEQGGTGRAGVAHLGVGWQTTELADRTGGEIPLERGRLVAAERAPAVRGHVEQPVCRRRRRDRIAGADRVDEVEGRRGDDGGIDGGRPDADKPARTDAAPWHRRGWEVAGEAGRGAGRGAGEDATARGSERRGIPDRVGARHVDLLSRQPDARVGPEVD